MYVYLNVERYTFLSRKREMRSVGHQTKDKLVCGELDTLVGKELDKVIYKVVKDGNVSGTRELLDTYDGRLFMSQL